ncbi:MAG: GntR family transcriptional regulator [Lachnospiraceae bacterium]|jgi:GntR family transcriptional regulator
MQLYIDNRSGAPIYDQIYSQIKDAILSGQVTEGEALPSIRALAKDLRISVITTKRAYDELESEGFIYTLPGKGCFVAERSTELLREENLKKIEEHMQEVRRLASACRLTENELDEMWRLQKEEAE